MVGCGRTQYFVGGVCGWRIFKSARVWKGHVTSCGSGYYGNIVSGTKSRVKEGNAWDGIERCLQMGGSKWL
jgi:hypothetical protein